MKSTVYQIVSLVCILIIVYLAYSEIHDFLNSGVKFHFVPDDELDTRMDLNVDFTIATPCRCKLAVKECKFMFNWSCYLFQTLEQMFWIQLDKVWSLLDS